MIVIQKQPANLHTEGVATLICPCKTVYTAAQEDFTLQVVRQEGGKETTEPAVDCPVCEFRHTLVAAKKNAKWHLPYYARCPTRAKIFWWKRKKKVKLPKATAKIAKKADS